MTRHKVIRIVLQKSYGITATVDACAEHVDLAWDSYGEVWERSDPLMMELWNWFSGGDIADYTAKRLRQAVGAMV